MGPDPEPGNYFEEIDSQKFSTLDLQTDNFPSISSVDNKWVFFKVINNKHFV